MIGTERHSERGLSVALTHVLTIGITTILIAMLLTAGSAMLDSETERSTETSLETVGERLAGEIDNVDRIAADDDDEVTIVADHPRTVANSPYTVALLPPSACDEAPLLDDTNPCLKLWTHNIDKTVYVPVAVDGGRIAGESSAPSGAIEITYDSASGEIELTEADR